MTRTRSDVVFLLVLLAASAAVNMGLLRQKSVPSAPPPVANITASLGRTVSDMHVKTLSGEPVLIRFRGSEKPTVLYVVRPSCTWCTRNADNIRHLFSVVKDQSTFVGLSMDVSGVRSYLNGAPVGFPTYVDPDAGVIQTLGLGRITPQTFVIGTDGVVISVFDGAFVAQTRTDVERFFQAPLPGLRPDGTSTVECADPSGARFGYVPGAVTLFKEGFRRCSPGGTWVSVTSQH